MWLCLKLFDSCIDVFVLSLLSIAGKANLEKADLEPALKALKDRLMTKNVVCFAIHFSILFNSGFCMTPLVMGFLVALTG